MEEDKLSALIAWALFFQPVWAFCKPPRLMKRSWIFLALHAQSIGKVLPPARKYKLVGSNHAARKHVSKVCDGDKKFTWSPINFLSFYKKLTSNEKLRQLSVGKCSFVSHLDQLKKYFYINGTNYKRWPSGKMDCLFWFDLWIKSALIHEIYARRWLIVVGQFFYFHSSPKGIFILNQSRFLSEW
jgi:hypothetical protein